MELKTRKVVRVAVVVACAFVAETAAANDVGQAKNSYDGAGTGSVTVVVTTYGGAIGVFALHFIMTATFLYVPQALVTDLGIASAGHWKVYLGVFVVSLAGTIPLILASERSGRGPALFVLAILAVAAAQGMLGFDHRDLWAVLGGLTLFFAGFNYLEARLPAQLSLAAPGHERGAALGIFATAQFLGAFLGGALGGVLLGRFGLAGVFWGSAAIALAWAGVAVRRFRRSGRRISRRTRLIRHFRRGDPVP